MIARHQIRCAAGLVDQRGGVAAAGCTHQDGHSAIVATAWIETLHSRAQRSAERHARSRQ
jgi:hypothetical protein